MRERPRNVVAIITGKTRRDLYASAESIRNGRTDGVSFYVSSDFVFVSKTHFEMSEEDQISELEWFLDGIEHRIEYQTKKH